MWETTLPLKSVVLFIACGTMVFIIVFIFAKRQITRFALKSSRGPHHPIGADVPKAMRLEIERRLNRVGDIKYEPKLLSATTEETLRDTSSTDAYHFYYRMKAVDAITLLDAELKNYSVFIERSPLQSLRMFLMDQRYNGPLAGVEISLVERFTQAYDHARHDPAEFLASHYQEYMSLLNQLIMHVRNRRNLKAAEKGKNGNDLNNIDLPGLNMSTENMNNSASVTGVETITLPPMEKKSDVQITYRPKRNGATADGLPLEQASSSVGSSQADISSLASERSCSSHGLETPV